MPRDALTAEANRSILEERARLLAVPQTAGRSDTTEAIAFRLGGERYAIDAAAVLNMAELGGLTPLPSGRDSVMGLTEWRGELLTVLDLRRILGLPASGLHDLGILVVLGRERAQFGILVAALQGLIRIDVTILHSARGGEVAAQGHVLGLSADATVVLNADSLLHAWRAGRS